MFVGMSRCRSWASKPDFVETDFVPSSLSSFSNNILSLHPCNRTLYSYLLLKKIENVPAEICATSLASSKCSFYVMCFIMNGEWGVDVVTFPCPQRQRSSACLLFPFWHLRWPSSDSGALGSTRIGRAWGSGLGFLLIWNRCRD